MNDGVGGFMVRCQVLVDCPRQRLVFPLSRAFIVRKTGMVENDARTSRIPPFGVRGREHDQEKPQLEQV